MTEVETLVTTFFLINDSVVARRPGDEPRMHAETRGFHQMFFWSALICGLFLSPLTEPLPLFE